MGAGLLGLAVGAVLFSVNKGQLLHKFKQTSFGAGLIHWCYHGLGFDALYDLIFVKPFLLIARLSKNDPIDKLWQILPLMADKTSRLLSKTQTGLLRSHAISFGLGPVLVLVLAMIMVV